MKRREAVLISNPNAGRGGNTRAREVARFGECLRERGVDVEVWNTAGPNDAARLAARAVADGAREIIVSGGDGTIHEALQGVMGAGVRLAIWPSGTANVLARQLGLPFDAEGAAATFAAGHTHRISIGGATDETRGTRRYFFLMAGVGLDASVVRRVRPALKRRVGEVAYWYSGLSHLADWRPQVFHVEIDGQTYEATYAAIGKSPRYGGGLAITPRARLEQPEFEVCLIDSRSRIRFLYLLTHAMRGGAGLDAPGIRFINAARVRATGDAATLVQADGELIGHLPMTFEIIPEPLEIIVP